MRVLVMGGTGLVGHRLVRRLRERQDGVAVLTRRPAAARERLPAGCDILEGDPVQAGGWMDAAGDCDAVVNLVGEPIFARRWGPEFIGLMRASRVKSTEHAVQALARKPRNAAGQPKVLVNASAIGFYGPHGDEGLTEEAPPGNDTLAGICVEWERAARAAEPHALRVAIVRIGVVLDKEGGALSQLLPVFKLGMGGPVASGKQWMSWIHHQDLTGILQLALDNGAAGGPINATAPEPVTNKVFAQALGSALHRPSFLPVPAFALRLRFGQVAEVLTTGQRVLPKRAAELGYVFQFTDVHTALRDVVGSSA